MSNVSHECVMSHVNESCLILMRHVSSAGRNVNSVILRRKEVREKLGLGLLSLTHTGGIKGLQHPAATHCSNTLQHTAMHCNTLQRNATHCNTLQHTVLLAAQKIVCIYRALEHMAINFITLQQHTATHCNTLQHTATHCNTPTYPHKFSGRQ